MRFAALTLFLGLLCAEAPWSVLFDGVSNAGWRGPLKDEFPGICWGVEERSIFPVPGTVMLDLWSNKTYRNFDLEFEFKLAPNANGGIKYLVQQGVALRRRGDRWLRAESSEAQPGDWYVEATAGLEFQIVDDANREAKDPKRRSGAMYSLVAPTDPPPIGPGVFHRGRIVVQGDRIEHHLNGRRVLEATLGSPKMEAAWDACKRSEIRRMAASEARIANRDHTSRLNRLVPQYPHPGAVIGRSGPARAAYRSFIACERAVGSRRPFRRRRGWTRRSKGSQSARVR